MKALFTALIAVIALHLGLFAQTRALSGIITDKENGNPIADVNVTLIEQGIFTRSTENGTFSFAISTAKPHQIRFEKLGYRPLTIKTEPGVNTLNIEFQQADISMGEVIVSSTKYGELLRETPIPMEMVNREKIDASPAIGVSDALRTQPGIALVRDGMWGTDLNIRGLSRQNVVTLVDGNRIETASNHAASLSLVDIMDVENIEVIKGGISSLYGTGATGGVVSITTRTAKFTDHFTIKGNLSSAFTSANNGGAGYLSLVASDIVWYAKATFTARSAENVRTPTGTLKNSYFRDKNYSATVGMQPLEGHQLVLNFQKFDGEDIGIPGGRSFPATALARYTEVSREMHSVEYKIRDLFPVLVNTSVKYFDQKITRAVELKPTAAQTLAPSANHKTKGMQLQTNWLVSSSSQLVGGVDYWQRTYNGFRTTTVKSGTVTKITADLPVPNSTYKSLGFYAQEDIRLLENKLRLTLGARYDFINISNDSVRNPLYIVTNGTINNNPPKNAQSSFIASKDDDKSWSANFGAMYQLFPDFDVTFNVSHAFRSPVLEERFQYINLGGDIFLGNPALNPEIGNFLDVGCRYWKNDLTVKANAFYNSFTDLVVDKAVIKDSLYQKANIGKAALYGFDASVEYMLISRLGIYSTASYVRGEDTKNSANLPQVPPFNGYTGFKYHLPGLFSLDINANWFASQNNTAAGELKTGGYTTWNLALASEEYGVGLIHGRLHAGIENIFDREYRDHLASTRGLIKTEPGRNVFVKLALHW